MVIHWKARWGALLLLFPLAGGGAWAATAVSPPVAGTAAHLASHSSQALPAGLRTALYQALAKNAGATYRIDTNGCVVLASQKLKACFDVQGAHFTGATPVSLHLVAFGRSGALTRVKPVPPVIHGNRVSYAHGDLTAWWRVLPLGFEQGFTIAKRPSGQGELTLALVATRHSRESGNPVEKASRPPAGIQSQTGFRVAPQSPAMTKKENGDTLALGKLRYGKLVVTDANEKVVPATLKSKGNRILITVNDARAAYPLTVDPLVWIEQKVTASDGAANDLFSWSVALSGTTALIGAQGATVHGNAGQGAAYIFAKSNGIWNEEQKLTASDGGVGDSFGLSVAISGATAIIGASNATLDGNSGQGAAYVFTNSGGTWMQTAELTASDGAANDHFGFSVAVSDAVALVGAYGTNDSQGAVYVFTNSGDGWTQTQKLIASDGVSQSYFGCSVALSGMTAIVGAFGTPLSGNTYQGAAYVFTDSGGTWTQAQELTANAGAAFDEFGNSVALSGDSALVGAFGTNSMQGVVYVFNKSDGTWTQSAELTANDAAPGTDFGYSVALSGTTALIGSFGANGFQGAAYLFSESNGTWAQTQKFVASDGTAGNLFGWSVALSESTALISAYAATVDGNSGQGAAYFEDESNLGLTVSTPETVGQGQQYTNQTIATNSASAASPAVSATITVPAAASFISATASQGSCNEAAGVVTCDFGQIAGNAGMATANVTLKVTGVSGTTIENTASIAKATPALTASAPTEITSPAACPAGYTEFSGHLDAGESFTSDPITVSEAGQKYVDLTSPASFGFFAIVTSSYGTHTYVYPHAKQGHRWGAAGSYQVGVQAGSSAGGDYTLCVNLNPAQ